MVLDHDDGDPRTVQMPSTSGPSAPGSARNTEGLPAVNRYRIVERLARGGMGEVMLAYDELVCRDVVIKRMLDPKPAADAVERFLREARLQGRLDHPSIVPVHEIAVEDSGAPYFVMKRLNGTTLSKIIKHKDERFTSRRLLRAFADICLAIEYAHVRGIVHRDIKPANIMLGDFARWGSRSSSATSIQGGLCRGAHDDQGQGCPRDREPRDRNRVQRVWPHARQAHRRGHGPRGAAPVPRARHGRPGAFRR